MKQYDTYKESGIEWIGEIPSHWEVKKLQFLAAKEKYSFTGGPFGSDLKADEYTQEGVRIIQLQNIGVGRFLNDYKIFTSDKKADELYNCNIFPEEIIVAKMADPVARACLIPKENDRYLMASDGIRIKVDSKKANNNYAVYSINSPYFNYEAVRNSEGTTRLRIGLSTVKKLKIILPPLKEQTTIANYLNRKTAEIDDLISDKKRLLELYEEEKTAFINQAVTKGLDPNVKMKDSGIEWLGEIPEHWVVKRLSWCFEIIGSGTTPKAGEEEYYYNGEFNWLLTGDLTDGEVWGTSKKITQKALDDYSSLKKYPANSIVMAMYGATIGKLGILKIPTTVNQACCVMTTPNHFNYVFAFYLLLAARKEIINMSYGGGQPNISQELIRSFRVQVPPLEEQQSIVYHIETECARIDAKKDKTKKLIDLLTEYRTALISEVVTGKINVIDEL